MEPTEILCLSCKKNFTITQTSHVICPECKERYLKPVGFDIIRVALKKLHYLILIYFSRALIGKLGSSKSSNNKIFAAFDDDTVCDNCSRIAGAHGTILGKSYVCGRCALKIMNRKSTLSSKAKKGVNA